jgi:hypothetical protein
MIDRNQRIAIQKVSFIESANEVIVELNFAGQLYQGKAGIESSDHAQVLAATQAAIAAVNSIIPTPIIEKVVEIQQVKFKALAEPVIVALVAVKIKGQQSIFCGSARSGADHLYAAVRATLDAINRPIGLVL